MAEDVERLKTVELASSAQRVLKVEWSKDGFLMKLVVASSMKMPSCPAKD